MTTKLIFVRHAESEGNLNRIFHGVTNSSLTSKGHIQAQRVAEQLLQIPIHSLYSSTSTRTVQTAEYISKSKNIPIIKSENLKEINGGKWENENWDSLSSKWPHEVITWEKYPHSHQMPDGENMCDFQERLIKEISNIMSKNNGNTVCIVTHGVAIRVLICYFMGLTLEQIVDINWCDNASISVVHYEENNFKVLSNGDISHLEESIRSDWC